MSFKWPEFRFSQTNNRPPGVSGAFLLSLTSPALARLPQRYLTFYWASTCATSLQRPPWLAGRKRRGWNPPFKHQQHASWSSRRSSRSFGSDVCVCVCVWVFRTPSSSVASAVSSAGQNGLYRTQRRGGGSFRETGKVSGVGRSPRLLVC